MITDILKRIKTELETPRPERWFGSGWLSGCGALLCGVVGLLLVTALRFPGVLTTPQLAFAWDTIYFRAFLHIVLMLGYLFALVSLLLHPKRMMGYVALGLVMIAALLGATHASVAEANTATIYFGLDFFVLNVLFTGFLFVPLERMFPKYKDQIVFRPEWNEDIFYYLVSSLIVQVVTFMTLAPAALVQAHTPLNDIRNYIGGQPFLLQLLLIMLFTDFVQYWLHRLFHRVPFLWQFHAVHHSAQSMDWLAGGRMHILEVFALRGFTAIPMLTMGFDPAAVQTYVLALYFFSAFVHSNVGWNLDPMEKFFVTPRFHHWHHGVEKEAIDVNFAIHFPVYDWLFGTYYMPLKTWPSGYGIEGHPVPHGYAAQFMYPFRWLKAEIARRKAEAQAAANP